MSKGYKYAGSDNADAVAWYLGNSDNRTHPVDKKAPNELEIYGMSGNVWEWCQDIYNENSIGQPSGEFRMTCGGSWFDEAIYCESAFVGKGVRADLTDHIDHIGFRLVCD